MLNQIRQFINYNRAVQNVDLEALLTPNRLTHAPKFPKKRKTYRTLSLARELRSLKKEYWYFQENSIVVDFMYGKNYKKKVITMCGTESCYRVRIDVWALAGGGNFYYKEFDYQTGASLLFELVALEVLDQTFIHSID